LFRLPGNPESPQHVAVIDDAEGRELDTDPAVFPVAKGFSADRFRVDLRGEPVGVTVAQGQQSDPGATGHQIARLRLLLEIVGTAAKKQVHAHANIRGQKGLARFPLLGTAPIRSARIGERTGQRLTPAPLQMRFPMVFEGSGKFGLEKQGDLGGAPWRAPVEVNRFTRACAPVLHESIADLLADTLVMRGEDDQTAIMMLRDARVASRQQERPGHGHQQGQPDQPVAPPVSLDHRRGTRFIPGRYG